MAKHKNIENTFDWIKNKEILTVVLTAMFGLLGFIYNQPIILSIFSFFITVLIFRITIFQREKVNTNSLYYGFFLALLIAIISQSIPDRSQYILIFTPLVVSLYLFLSHASARLFLNGLNRLAKESENARDLQKLFSSIFFTLSTMIYFILIFFMILLSKEIFVQASQNTSFLYTLISGTIISFLLDIKFWLIPIVIFILVKITIYFEKKKSYKRLGSWLILKVSLLTIPLLLIIVTLSIIFYPLFFVFYGLYINSMIESNFKTCQLNETNYASSSLNPFSSICYERIFYLNNEGKTLQYFIFMPESKIINYFELSKTNNTVGYNILCNGFENKRNITNC